MNFKSRESAKKLRGGYYTPPPIADFLSHWALEHQPQRVLEPSCGDGHFLQAIFEQINSGNRTAPAFIDAVEIIPQEAQKADLVADSLRKFTTEVKVVNDDFFNWFESVNGNKWDAIIGNPPYIRYQYFETEQRDKAKAIFKQANTSFSKRTNAWVPFVIASIMHLAPNGRLAMVVPSEIMHIQHANGLRLFLEQEMQLITIIHFREIVFPETLQGVVLLLGIKKERSNFAPLPNKKNTLQLSLFEFEDRQQADLQIIDLNDWEDLQNLKLTRQKLHQKPPAWNGNWMLALLDDEELAILDCVQENKKVFSFEDIAEVDIGIVTGANKFFVVNDSTLSQYQMSHIAAPMLAKSELIKGISYTNTDHESNRLAGKDVHFLSFPNKPVDELPSKMRDYIEFGELQSLHTRYKCRIRTPWYVVPYVWVSGVGLLKRCHRFPRLVLNKLGAYSTDTAYRIKMKSGYENQAKNLVFSFLNSLTFLYAELLGRHYGGGVLELVPSEIEKLQIPLVSASDEQFLQVDEMIREEVDLETLLDYTDTVILEYGIGLSKKQIETIRLAHKKLMLRRLRVNN